MQGGNAVTHGLIVYFTRHGTVILYHRTVGQDWHSGLGWRASVREIRGYRQLGSRCRSYILIRHRRWTCIVRGTPSDGVYLQRARVGGVQGNENSKSPRWARSLSRTRGSLHVWLLEGMWSDGPTWSYIIHRWIVCFDFNRDRRLSPPYISEDSLADLRRLFKRESSVCCHNKTEPEPIRKFHDAKRPK